jgi:hypothetical protein
MPRVGSWSSRILTNALIGFTRSDPSWPSPLRSAGWHLNIIEPAWLVDREGEPRPEKIRPDLVLAADTGESVLVVDCKVGSVQIDQLERYLLLDAARLRAQCSVVPLNDFCITYATIDSHAESCVRSIGTNPVALVIFSDESVNLVHHRLPEVPLDALFRTGVDIRGLHPPTRYIPFDSDASAADVIPDVVSALIRFAGDGMERFTPRDVVRDVFEDSYAFLHTSYRTELEIPVKKGLGELAKAAALGDILSFMSGMWTLKADFGKSGGLRFSTATRRATKYLETLRDQMTLDL